MERNPFKFNPLSVIVFSIFTFSAPSVQAWCAVAKEAAVNGPARSSACSAYGTETNSVINANCTDQGEDLFFDLPDPVIRGLKYQPAATLVFPDKSLRVDDASNVGAETILNCFGDPNAQRVFYQWKIADGSPEIINVGSLKLFATTSPSSASAYGLFIKHGNTEFPTATQSDIRAIPAKLSGLGQDRGYVNFMDIGEQLVIAGRKTGFPPLPGPLIGQPQLKLEISYFTNDSSATPSTLSYNVHFGANASPQYVNTCGVYSDAGTVYLSGGKGSSISMSALDEGSTPIVPFTIHYRCDGEIGSKNVNIGFQPSDKTTIVGDGTLIRAVDSSSTGIGIAYSKEGGGAFSVLPWLPAAGCPTYAHEGFCSTPRMVNHGGWLSSVVTGQGNSETFYARMLKIDTEKATAGTVNGTVRVIVTHD